MKGDIPKGEEDLQIRGERGGNGRLQGRKKKKKKTTQTTSISNKIRKRGPGRGKPKDSGDS